MSYLARWAAALDLRPATNPSGCVLPLTGKRCKRTNGRPCVCDTRPAVFDHVATWRAATSGALVLTAHPYRVSDVDAVALEAHLAPHGLAYAIGLAGTGTWSRQAEAHTGGNGTWTTPVAVSLDADLAHRVVRHDEPLTAPA